MPSKAGVDFASASQMVGGSVAQDRERTFQMELGDKPAAGEQKPNIVFILVDNVGWGGFGVYGGTTPTPRIDRLASEGSRFNT